MMRKRGRNRSHARQRRRKAPCFWSEWIDPGRLESKTRVQLDLTPRAHSCEDPADVAGEITGDIFEYGVSIPTQGKWALRVAGYSKVWMIEQVVSFCSKRKRGALQFELLVHSEIKLREGRAAQDITSSITKLTCW